MRVTIICEDNELNDYLSYVTRRAGYDVRYRSAQQLQGLDDSKNVTDLFVLHIPNLQPGLKLLKEAGSVIRTPILAVIQDTNQDAQAAVLDAGADSVLVLPVSPKLCLASIQSLLRRTRSLPTPILPTLDFGSIMLNPGTRSVTSEGRESIRLTQLEFRLLYLLMTHPGQVMPTEVIVDRVWGYGESGGKDLVRGLVSRLRGKVEPDASQPRFLHTIPAVGYFFDPDGQ
jgi:two-component system response regulator RegX3